jgi:hypothetical protein
LSVSSGDGVVLVVTWPVVWAARDQVVRVRDAFGNLVVPLGSAHQEVTDGAGQFLGDLDVGAARFHLSWKAVFGVCSASAGLIAANTGQAVLNVHAVDAAHVSEGGHL